MTTKLCRKAFLRQKFCWTLLLVFLLSACMQKETTSPASLTTNSVWVSVLGVAQDAGFPQAGCEKDCCAHAWETPSIRKKVVCLGIVDQTEKISWMVEASPDFPDQHRDLKELAAENDFGGIFLTHAHIGHYAGLIHLGREVMGTSGVPVYAMPRMEAFLDSQGPWEQLVKLQNIEIRPLKADSTYILSSQIAIRPILVPHRKEYSETVGYLIKGPKKSLLFIPDIDKWSAWEQNINTWIEQVDYALLDGTFFANGEIPGRDMSQIPHPFIEESLERFASLSPTDKAKVFFIHFNHTNPILQPNSEAQGIIQRQGMNWAREGQRFDL